MKTKTWSAFLFLTATIPVQAGVITMTDHTGERAYSIDPATGTATVVATGNTANAWGAAYDPTAATLYWNDGSQLRIASGYTGGPLAPTSTVSMTFGQSAINFVGLAFDTAASRLIGVRNIATLGFYQIDPATGEATLLTADTGANFGGIDYDPVTGHLYGATDSGNTGLYRIEGYAGSPVYTFLAPLPDGVTDLDGLAAGDGRLYLILDEPSPIYVFDLATNSYVNPLPGPFTAEGLFSAGAYILDGGPSEVPEPGSFALAGLGLAGAAALRALRRRA